MLFEPMQDHIYQIPERVELFQICNRLRVPDNPRNAQVQTAENHPLPVVVLDEGDDFPAGLEGLNILDVVVDGRILVALCSIVEDFLEHSNVFKCEIATRIAMALHVWQVQILFHLLEDLGQEDDVLCRVFEHFGAQRTFGVPEGLI